MLCYKYNAFNFSFTYLWFSQDDRGEEVSGFGLFKNMTAAWDDIGYITDLYTKEAEKSKKI